MQITIVCMSERRLNLIIGNKFLRKKVQRGTKNFVTPLEFCWWEECGFCELNCWQSWVLHLHSQVHVSAISILCELYTIILRCSVVSLSPSNHVIGVRWNIVKYCTTVGEPATLYLLLFVTQTRPCASGNSWKCFSLSDGHGAAWRWTGALKWTHLLTYCLG